MTHIIKSGSPRCGHFFLKALSIIKIHRFTNGNLAKYSYCSKGMSKSYFSSYHGLVKTNWDESKEYKCRIEKTTDHRITGFLHKLLFSNFHHISSPTMAWRSEVVQGCTRRTKKRGKNVSSHYKTSLPTYQPILWNTYPTVLSPSRF